MRPANSSASAIASANSCHACSIHLEALSRLLGQSFREDAGVILLSEHPVITNGNRIFRHACAMGPEGIVAKRRDKPYRSGRSRDWIKAKNPDARAATR